MKTVSTLTLMENGLWLIIRLKKKIFKVRRQENEET